MNRTVDTMRSMRVKVLIAVFLISLGYRGVSLAGNEAIDINALIQETQRMSQSANKMTLVWWTPEEFWRASFSQDQSMTATQIEEFIKVLEPYTLVVAVDGTIGIFGGATFKPKAFLRESIQIIDREGIHYLPLSDDSIDPDAKNFLSIMTPILGNMLGSMGENMHFFLFPAKGKNGENIAVASKEGSFSVKLDNREFKWRLPLGSVLPPKVCPEDGETLNGAWKFCPWHGDKLK